MRGRGPSPSPQKAERVAFLGTMVRYTRYPWPIFPSNPVRESNETVSPVEPPVPSLVDAGIATG